MTFRNVSLKQFSSNKTLRKTWQKAKYDTRPSCKLTLDETINVDRESSRLIQRLSYPVGKKFKAQHFKQNIRISMVYYYLTLF